MTKAKTQTQTSKAAKTSKDKKLRLTMDELKNVRGGTHSKTCRCRLPVTAVTTATLVKKPTGGA